MNRRSFLPLGALLACLVALPACGKKAPKDGDGPGGDPGPAPGTPPAAVTSDFVAFVRLDAKAIRDNAVVTELKQAFGKSANGTAVWDKMETEAIKGLGVKPTEIDSVTACVADVGDRGPNVIVIIAANKAFNKNSTFDIQPGTKPDSRGFYKERYGNDLVHFPDDKTAVLVSPALADKYLEGYAKNRSGWPMTAEFTKAASGRTLYAYVNLDKLPPKMRNELERDREFKDYTALLGCKALSVAGDLRGKELSLSARGTFADAVAAGQGKAALQKALALATGEIEKVMNGKLGPAETMFLPAIKAGHRALKDAKVETSGADVTFSGTYKADFDLAKMAADAVKTYEETLPRLTAQNNLKQIGVALHNYASAYGDALVVHGTGANGAPLKNATEKPLLSWRVAILPYIEQDNLYRQFKLNEPWDSEHNKKLIPMMPKTFAPAGTPGQPGMTHLQMVIGPGGMQPGATIRGIAAQDGTSNTVAVIEGANAVTWTKPDDIVLPAKPAPGAIKKLIGGQFPKGFHVLMWDGSVRFVPDTVSENTLRLLFDPRDGMVIPSDW
jgi:hypothetical protein